MDRCVYESIAEERKTKKAEEIKGDYWSMEQTGASTHQTN